MADFSMVTPMLVMRFDVFQGQGHIPRSDEAQAKGLLEEFAEDRDQIAVFISHQWWRDLHPDYADGPKANLKFRTIVQGVEQLSEECDIDRRQLVLWMDWFSIAQDDKALKLKGIRSLIKYVTLSSFMLIPCKETPDPLEPNPGRLPGYGPRAWCRCEWLIFSMWAEMQVVRPEEQVRCTAPIAAEDADVSARHREVVNGRFREIGIVDAGPVRVITQLYAISLQGASGLKWTNVGAVKPKRGRPIRNAKLARALKTRTEFNDELWKDLMDDAWPCMVCDGGEERLLRTSDFIKSGNCFYTPGPEEITKYEEVTITEEEELPAAGDLSQEEDRAHIIDLQEQMLAEFVPTMIRNQCAGGDGATINMDYRMVRDRDMPEILAALRQLGPNTPGNKWKIVDETEVDGICACNNCGKFCIEVWNCKDCDKEGEGFGLCNKCHASLGSGGSNDSSDIHDTSHAFEFKRYQTAGELECQALASALQHKMVFTREELDRFKLPALSFSASYIRVAGKCYRPAPNSLSLTGCKLTAEGYRQLAAFLSDDSTLQELCCDDSKGMLDADGAAALIAGLKTNTGLRVLDLGFNKEAGTAWHSDLADVICTHPTLETLNLHGCGVSDEGATALGHMLATNTTLKDLSVYDNDISSKGALALASGLGTNHALCALEIEGNPLGDEGATAIAQSLGERKALTGRTLESLRISMRKGLTDAGREALRRAADEAFVEDLSSGVDSDDSADGEDSNDGSCPGEASSGSWSTEDEEEL